MEHAAASQISQDHFVMTVRPQDLVYIAPKPVPVASMVLVRKENSAMVVAFANLDGQVFRVQ